MSNIITLNKRIADIFQLKNTVEILFMEITSSIDFFLFFILVLSNGITSTENVCKSTEISEDLLKYLTELSSNVLNYLLVSTVTKFSKHNELYQQASILINSGQEYL